jgi:hypothetical protein
MFKSSRRAHLLALATVAALGATALLPGTALAFDANSSAAVNVDAQGIGIQGHDPVAYFKAGAPSLG